MTPTEVRALEMFYIVYWGILTGINNLPPAESNCFAFRSMVDIGNYHFAHAFIPKKVDDVMTLTFFIIRKPLSESYYIPMTDSCLLKLVTLFYEGVRFCSKECHNSLCQLEIVIWKNWYLETTNRFCKFLFKQSWMYLVTVKNYEFEFLYLVEI